ncbi:MAG: hypothetical protein CO175_08215 [Verrucomicrobia bacterium CG_4_9_14_3_um_filter_43_20]|nr:ChbG/HpnK family deacetylase [Bacteroidota bacterium]PJA43411.1 MAG: hypothetical protein CO175_08215 [Verrucomicrobia bacterium CG_4_9_14_3_um_filter_43_20]
MLNFDDYGMSDDVNKIILSYAPNVANCAISVMANRVTPNGIVMLQDSFRGRINLHVDLVEGPFLNKHLPNNVDAAAAETRAQLNKLVAYGIAPAMIDFHQNAHKRMYVMRSLIRCSSVISNYKLRPLIQSRLMRPSSVLQIKNFAAACAQRLLSSTVFFADGSVMSGLDKFPRHRWGELLPYLYSEKKIIPCHPHLYKNEKLFCDYISKYNA